MLPDLAILPLPDVALTDDFAWEMIAVPPSAEPTVYESGFDIGAFAAAAALFTWFMVAFAWLSLKIETQARFVRVMLASSKPAPNEIALSAEAIRRSFKVRMPLRVRLCDENYGPAVVGLFRPVIFLPANFLSAYSAEERRLALAHEIAHIARGDLAAALVALVFQTAQWPNPLVHFAARQFRLDQEAACDAFVLARYQPDPGAPGDYASAIIKSANGVHATPAFGLTLGHPVKERLMLLTKPNQSRLRKIAGGASAVALVLAGLASTASYSYAADDTKKDEAVKKEKRVMIIGGDAHKDGVVEMDQRVIVIKDGEDTEFVMPIMHGGDYEFVTEDGEHRVFKYVTDGGEHGHHMKMKGMGDCTATDGEGEPVKLEWSEEADKDGGMKTHSIICVGRRGRS